VHLHDHAAAVIRREGGRDLVLLDLRGRIDYADIFVLCSDGLTDVLDDEQLRKLMVGHAPEDLPDLLTEAALQAGAMDLVHGAKRVAVITDARFSGVSTGACIAN
jgi:serine/threonine protein phosphatase PrpC